MEKEPKQIPLPVYFALKFFFLLAVLAAIFFLSSCTSKPHADVHGTWETLMTTNDNMTNNMATIPFEGNPTKGTYLQINMNETEYDGEQKIRRSNIALYGYENWDGEIVNKNTISGTWHHTAEAEGSFETTRK